MRIQYWPALVCGWMMVAATGQAVLAERPSRPVYSAVSRADAMDDSDSDSDDDSEAEDGLSLAPAYQPTQFAGAGAPGYGPGMAPPAGVPFDPGMPPPNAWPEPSPFSQHRIEETYNDTGLWRYNTDDNFDKQWKLGLDYLYGHGQKAGNNFIGNPQLGNSNAFPGAPGVYPSQTTSGLPRVFENGVKVSYGYTNPDGSGLTLSGFVLFENTVDTISYGGNPKWLLGVAGTQTPLAQIIVGDGAGNGIPLTFDTAFSQHVSQQILGSDADFYLAPFFERQSFKLKWVFGAKYLMIHEDFRVQGTDSGLNYTVTPPITGPFSELLPPYTTTITSATTNNLVGPMLGVRYDLGGDKIKFWGQTKFGLMADIEKLGVSSAGLVEYKQPLGLGASPSFGPGPALGAPPILPSSQQRTNTHVSPIIDTSIYMELPIFAMIPYVNQWQVLKNANFRVGWNYVFVGEIARAPSIINYNINNATIHSARTMFGYDTVNFAVDWKW